MAPKILKTYTRVFTHSLDIALPLYLQLVDKEPDFHVAAGQLQVVALGGFLILAGTDEALAPIRSSIGTIVVDDLEETKQLVEAAGAIITQGITPGPTGSSIHARHPDGNTFEYVQWTDEYLQRILK